MVAVPVITSDGTDLPASFDLVSVEVVREVNRIPYAQIVLTDGEVAKAEFPALDSDALAPGAAIEIKIREGDDITPLFEGQVAKVRLEYSGGGPRLVAECKDRALRLTSPRQSVIYPEGSDSDAIAAVLRRAELDSGDLGSSSGKSTLVQYDSTDWDFIVSRAQAAGSAIVVTDGTIAVKPLAVSGTAAWTVQLGIDDVDDFELELDAGSQNPDVSAISWDLPQGATTDPAAAAAFELAQGNVDPADAGQKLGVGEAVLRHLVPTSSDELKAWASARLAQTRLSMIRGRLSLDGAGDIEPTDLVELSGFGARFNGNALVTGVRHTIADGEWRTDLRLGLSSEPFAEPEDITAPPAQGLIPAARGLTIAVVSDFEDDPDGEYRLRLTLPAMTTGDDKIWARLAAPEAGNGRGFFFRPDPGDEVIVGFLAEDPRQPIVLGALFGSKNKPPSAFADVSADNNAKGLATKHGMSLALEDRKGKAVMSLKTPKGTLAIDDDKGEIRISDGNKNSILFSKDGIALKSGKDLKIEAAGKLILKGASIDAN